MKRGCHGTKSGGARRGRRRYGAAALVCNALLLFLAMPERMPAAAHVPVILAFGDSLTAGFGLPSNEAFPARLEAKLQREGIATTVENGGNSGDTTADGLARVDWELAGQPKPGFVILELGANDALRGLPPELVRANLEKTIVKIKRTGAKLLLAGMLAPPNWGKAYERAFDAIYPELAKRYHVMLYPFFLDGLVDGTALNPKLTQADGHHPNERGVEVIVDRIAPYVVRLLGDRK